MSLHILYLKDSLELNGSSLQGEMGINIWHALVLHSQTERKFLTCFIASFCDHPLYLLIEWIGFSTPFNPGLVCRMEITLGRSPSFITFHIELFKPHPHSSVFMKHYRCTRPRGSHSHFFKNILHIWFSACSKLYLRILFVSSKEAYFYILKLYHRNGDCGLNIISLMMLKV